MSAANETGTGIAGAARFRSQIVQVRQMRSCRNPCGSGPDPVQSGQVVRRRTQGPGIIYRRSRARRANRDSLSSPSRKNILVHFKAKSLHRPPRPASQEGRFAIVTDVGCGMRWTRQRQKTNDIARGRRSRVVLTPRRWRQVLEKASCKFLGDDGGNKARSPGRARNKP
jgi:hypothetical protein